MAPQSAGLVTSALTYDRVTLLPVVGGLFCPNVFGPWSPPSDDERGERAVAADRRSERWGQILLSSARTLDVVPPAYRAYRWLDAAQLQDHVHAWRAGERDVYEDACSKDALMRSLWPWTRKRQTARIVDEEDFDPWPDAGGGLIEAPINCWYRLVIHCAKAVERLTSLAATGPLDHERSKLTAALHFLGAEIDAADIPEEIRRLGLPL
jgi:hypothetical protein